MKQDKRTRLGRGLMLGLCVSLGACAGKTPSAEISSAALPGRALFCLEAQPIIFSRLHDTEETIRQIKAHNAVGVKLCGWTGEKP